MTNGKARKSGRSLGDRGECARCRNGDLMGKAASSKQKLPQLRWLFRAKILQPITSVLAAAGLILVGSNARAQDPAAAPANASVVLENHDRPMEIPFQCTED